MSRQLRLLLVEDSADDVELLLYELSSGGINPLWRRVQTVPEMSAALAESPWDLILSDYSMPGFGAEDALQLLQQTGQDIPFIVVSGSIGEEVAVRMMRFGASDYLLKQNLQRLVPAVEKELREADNRRARREAERTARQLAALVQSSDDAIIGMTLDGVILSWNQAADRLYGWSAAETIGHPVTVIVPPERLEELAGIMSRLRRGERVERLETLRLHRDGRRLDVSLTISPILDDQGRPAGASTIARDITGRKRLEEQYRQAQKMEAVGRLAGGVAHDFNNLLTIINGYSEMLLNALQPGDPHRAMVDEIKKAGERSAGLTRQLLTFSRQEVVVPRMLDLNQVIIDLEKMLRRIIGEDIQLATALGTGLGPIQADPGQAEQVIMNLVVNARDAMPQGGQLVLETRNVELGDADVGAQPGARPGPHVLLAVSDTGSGMTREVQAKIFEPFFTTKGAGKGTGLGLAVVHGIVQQSGGHVGVYSEVGVGTTFKIYLPRTDQPSQTAPARSAPGEALRGGETVLLVEDEQAVRALTHLVLKQHGYVVLEAASGKEAIQVAERHQGPIHLLVTDVVMPGLSGRQVAERLQVLHPEAKVLYLSGYTDDAVIRHGILHAQGNFLQKPFSPRALAHKVRAVLAGKLDETAVGRREPA